jgi:tetratricopeptide (TPR) repeat protein
MVLLRTKPYRNVELNCGRQMKMKAIVRLLRYAMVVLAWIVFGLACSTEKDQQANDEKQLEQQLNQIISGYDQGSRAVMDSVETLSGSCLAKRNACKAELSVLYKLAGQYIVRSDFQLTIDLAGLGRRLSKAREEQEQELKFLLLLVESYNQLNNHDSTKAYINILDSIPEQLFTDFSKGVLINIKALQAQENGNYLEAIEGYWKARDLFAGHPKQQAVVGHNLAHLFISLKNYSRASNHLEAQKQYYESINDTINLPALYTNMGIVKMHLDSLEESEYYYQQSLRVNKNNNINKAKTLANYGNLLRHLGEYKKALTVIDSSYQISAQLGIPYGMLVNTINKAEVLLAMGQPQDALVLIQSVLAKSDLLNEEMNMECTRLLAMVHEQFGDIPLAFTHQKKYEELRAGIAKKGADKLVLEWEDKINREEKDRELTFLNNQLTINRIRHRIMVVILLLLLLLVLSIGGLAHLHRQRQRIQAKLLLEESENLRLQLELKEREITTQTIHLQSIGQATDDHIMKLSNLSQDLPKTKRDELAQIIKDFENGVPEEMWEDFRLRFEKINESFYNKLLQIAPDLSPVELKVASFVRLNLSSKEISRLTNRTSGTVTNTRSSLRRKLKLEEDDSLVAFLMSL